MSRYAEEHAASGSLHSVIEIFGPTIQGEGAVAGQVSHFIRFAGCGYRCSWCDSMHAVDPAQILKHRQLLSNQDIIQQLLHLGPAKWVTLSGGDPCLRGNLAELIRSINFQGFLTSVETQGQFFQPWLHGVDQVTLSPKPPSSQMPFDNVAEKMLAHIIEELRIKANRGQVSFKIVIFDDNDLEFAKMIHRKWPDIKMYLSVGTPPLGTYEGEAWEVDTQTTHDVLARTQWLFEAVAAHPELHHVTVFPQLHVLAWGTKQGV